MGFAGCGSARSLQRSKRHVQDRSGLFGRAGTEGLNPGQCLKTYVGSRGDVELLERRPHQRVVDRFGAHHNPKEKGQASGGHKAKKRKTNDDGQSPDIQCFLFFC